MTHVETSPSDQTRRTPRGLDRLMYFSDATVAIAITLLILPLVDVANQISTHPAREVLESHAATLAGFAITFAVIGRFWLIHHRVFELVDGYTYALRAGRSARKSSYGGRSAPYHPMSATATSR